MGHIKYNETNNSEEEKCRNKDMKNNEVSKITAVENTEPKGNTYSEHALGKQIKYARLIQCYMLCNIRYMLYNKHDTLRNEERTELLVHHL